MSDFLVLQAARFGDLVQTKRLICTLVQRGQVHLAVDTSLVPIACLLYPKAIVHGLHLHGSLDADALTQNRRIFDQWQHIDFQNIYNCNFSLLTSAICRLFDLERVVGYRPTATGIERSSWARMAFRISEKRLFSPLNLVDFWGHFVPDPIPAIDLNPPARGGGQGLGVVLAGRESRRSLPLPLLAAVLQTVFGLMGGPQIRLLGTQTERPAARKLLRLLPVKMHDRVEDLSGKTDWPGLVLALRGLDAIITPDTGIMHLAAHLGVPVLAFFLSSAWCHETGPYGEGHHVWQAVCSCSPCLENIYCPHETGCLKAFSPEGLLRSLAWVLQKQKYPSDMPDGLQIWRSGHDRLGGLFFLLGGNDDRSMERAAVRDILYDFLQLPRSLQHRVTDDTLRSWLCPDIEWMLPPGRYA